MITGRAWRDLPIIIILGLVIGLVFGQIVKLTSPEPSNIASQAKAISFWEARPPAGSRIATIRRETVEALDLRPGAPRQI
ncbi:hypothetical protein KHP60_04425 [Microvirga sp. 3-52]|uniref:hypothetical protein n=1 Tax=Microvirga sp. 3-52 TaxID=2792425 RepID=UPI001ACA98D9|nr:hypothetical protein [Microvirga sp. 3-52]MBO1903976.1 hypothetical protein [Microvirga sp. 3-52]MBS7451591.1 hypothetical protein [Microvirga sp. 3-52]